MQTIIPHQVKKYFWGDNLRDLNWPEHQHYITEVLLNKGDVKSLSWLFKLVNRSDLLSSLPNMKLQPKSKTFWSIYLS